MAIIRSERHRFARIKKVIRNNKISRKKEEIVTDKKSFHEKERDLF